MTALSRAAVVFSLFLTNSALKGSEPLYPTKDLARFVVDHLDVRSFPTSLGARRDARGVFFRDYGIVPDKVTGNEAGLKKSDGTWFFVVTILKRTDSGIFVCFQDRGEFPAHYYTEDVLWLIRRDSTSALTGKKSGVAFKECPVFEK